MTAAPATAVAYQHRYFERTADRLPSAIAVDDHGERLTYAALEARANRIARLLTALGCAPNRRVVLFTRKHSDQYAGLLAILKAGGCWVPFSLAFPLERLRTLTTSLQPCAAIVDSTTFEAACTMRRESRCDFPLIVLGAVSNADEPSIHGEATISAMPADRQHNRDATPDDLAYIIFTSGSTGTPKGVMVRHRNTAYFLDLCPGLFGIAERSRFAHFSELTFDPSIFDLFHAWATGGTVVPFNRRKYRIDPGLFLRDQSVNVLFCVPTVIATLAESGQLGRSEFASIRHLLLTGEPVSAQLVRQWYDAYPDSTAYNLYGTTETAIISHCYRIPQRIQSGRTVPVGFPIDGMRVRLFDGDTPARTGEAGESTVSGPQVSPGYWDSPYQTAASFVADPLDPRVPQAVYRTGDRLRCDADGLFHFVGRIDDQIKVRGHRVEPGEIEQAIVHCDGVRDAAIVAVSPGPNAIDKRLIAFVRLDGHDDTAAIRRAIGARLPDWLIPAAILPVLQDFPRNTNGKIDRNALMRLALDHVGRENRNGI